MRYMLYTTLTAAFLLSSCANLPWILKDAELGVQAVEVGLEAEEQFVDEINKGNSNAINQIKK